MKDHMTSEDIQTLVQGRATTRDLDDWLEHMEACEKCLASVDEAWSLLKTKDDIFVPDLDSTHISTLQTRILHRIHTFEVGKQTLRLALVAPIAFLQGLFSSKRR